MNPEDWRLIIIKIKTNLLPNSWNLEVKKKMQHSKKLQETQICNFNFIYWKQIQKFYKN